MVQVLFWRAEGREFVGVESERLEQTCEPWWALVAQSEAAVWVVAQVVKSVEQAKEQLLAVERQSLQWLQVPRVYSDR